MSQFNFAAYGPLFLCLRLTMAIRIPNITRPQGNS